MFFRSRKREPAGEEPRVADVSDAGTDEATLRTGPAARGVAALGAAGQPMERLARGGAARDRDTRYRAFVPLPARKAQRASSSA